MSRANEGEGEIERLEEEQEEEREQNPTWKTKEGEILIKDMDDNHLKNTIRYIQKQFMDRTQNVLYEMHLLPEPQGEMAQQGYEREISLAEGMLADDKEMHIELLNSRNYRGMIEEAQKRGFDWRCQEKPKEKSEQRDKDEIIVKTYRGCVEEVIVGGKSRQFKEEIVDFMRG